MKRIGGARRKTRNIMRKHSRDKGKVSVSKYLQEFSKGDKVCLKAEPAVQDGTYFRRFHGRTGIVKSKRGECYSVTIEDQNKEKTVVVHPIHLRKI